MKNKFDNVPVEEDTKILFSTIAKFGDYDVQYEKWKWDGIYGEGLIFFNDDIEDTSEDKLKIEIQDSPLVESGEVTVKRTDPYTFFNFNFNYE